MLLELMEVYRKMGEKNSSIPSYKFSDYSDLHVFLKKKLKKSIFKKKNAKVLLNQLDMIMKSTNSTNIEWINYKSLLNQPNFLEEFNKNIKNFVFKEYLTSLLIPLEKYFGLDTLYSDDFIKNFTSSNPDARVIQYVFSRLTNNKKNTFLDCLLQNNIDITMLFEKKEDAFLDLYTRMNLEDVLSNESTCLFRLKNVFKGNSFQEGKIRKYIEENKSKAIHTLFNLITEKNNMNITSTNDEIVRLIINDLCENEHVSLSDLDYNNQGLHSLVCFIGNKVLKIGKDRLTETFPNNPCIVKPLLRKRIGEGNNSMFLEVTERVSTKRKVNPFDLYVLYKRLRNYGLIWGDIRLENVGYLNKPNDIYWRHNLNPSDEALGLEKNVDEDTVYGFTDIILLDADQIYKEGEIREEDINLIGFEKIFQAELEDLVELIERLKPNDKEYDSIASNNGFRGDYVRKKQMNLRRG